MADERPGLLEEEIEQAAALLSRLKPGFLPAAIFNQVTRLVVTPVVELLTFRLTMAGEVEVLLKKRPPDDPIWPDAYHSPGTVIRATDRLDHQGRQAAFERLFKDELAMQGDILPRPHFWRLSFRQVERGFELAQECLLLLPEGVELASFYPLDRLPDTLIDHHRQMINEAVASTLFAELMDLHIDRFADLWQHRR